MKELTYPTNLDEINKWLYDNFGLLPGCCSSINELRHSTARMIAEALWPKKAQIPEGLDKAAKEYASHIRITDTKRVCGADEWLYLFSDLLDAFKAGSAYQAEQDNRDVVFWQGMQYALKRLKEEGVERIVKVDSGGYPYIDATELYDYTEDRPLAKKGDKVFVVIL